jgi:protein SCO1
VRGLFGTRKARLLLAGFLLLLSAEIGVYLYLGRVAQSGGGLAAADTPAIGGPFSLVDQDGKAVTDRDFQDKWLIVYFGYTHCPDACPTALSALAAMMDKLGPVGERVRPLFITVDPERDTQAVLKDYVSAFAPSIVGLTGTLEQTSAVAKSYRVYAAKGPVDATGGYEVAHSSVLYVMDPTGRFVRAFGLDMTPEQMAASVKQLDSQWRPGRAAKPGA